MLYPVLVYSLGPTGLLYLHDNHVPERRPHYTDAGGILLSMQYFNKYPMGSFHVAADMLQVGLVYVDITWPGAITHGRVTNLVRS